MRFGVLGALRVERDDGSILTIQAPKTRSLLAALLIEAPRMVPSARLQEVMWERKPPASALASLHNHVMRLRRALDDPDGRVIRTRQPGYLIEILRDDLDLHRFTDLYRRGQESYRDGDWAATAQHLTAALSLWRGAPLLDIPAPFPTDIEVSAWEEMRLQAIEWRIDAELHLGRHRETISELQALTAAYPLRERFCAQLMLACYRAGRQGEALAAYREVRTLLAVELGVEPGPALQRLHGQILVADNSIGLPDATEADASYTRYIPPAHLPADLPGFAGRSEAIAALDALVGPDVRTRPTMVAITGAAGIGKTALAVHWAHTVRDQYPDGQLHVNLRGFDPTGHRLSADAVIRGFLDALGVPKHRVPAGLDGQAGLYRTLLADRRVLVILDNARDHEQIRALLPGSAGCMTVVTSRNSLTGLIASAGAIALTLDVLSDDDASALLRARLGASRVLAEPDATREIIDRCARLPLALAIVAAQIAGNPGIPLAALATELAVRRGSLDVFTTTDATVDVRAVLSWSYHALGAPGARLFRLLGLFPGPLITPGIAASLLGEPVAEGRRRLAELTEAHLLEERTLGEFSRHDLLHAYARELVTAVDDDTARDAALTRMHDHVVHTAYAASVVLDPARAVPVLGAAVQGTIVEPLAKYTEALAWFTRHHANLLAVLDRCVETENDAVTSPLVWTTTIYLTRLGHWHDQVHMQRAGLAARQRRGQIPETASSHRAIGRALIQIGSLDEARSHLEHAQHVYVSIGDTDGESNTLLDLAWIWATQDRHEEALAHAQQALELSYRMDDDPDRGFALNAVGWYQAQLGRHALALETCQAAMTIHQRGGNLRGQAEVWDSLGFIHQHLEKRDEAVRCYGDALKLYRELRDRHGEADTLEHLGDMYDALGAQQAAVDHWRQALLIFEQLDHPTADAVAKKLDM